MTQPGYRRAFSTLGCPDLSLDDVLALAVRHGLDAVELRALEGTVELPGLFARRFGTTAAFAERMSGGPAIASLDTSFRLIGNTGEDRLRLLDFVPWAAAARVPRLRVFDGGSTGDDAEIAAAGETLAWWGALRRRHGWAVELMVETHDAFAHPLALARLLAAEPGCVLLWDAHHTWRKGGEDPVRTWRALRPHVPHIHVKDSIDEKADRLPYRYVRPGSGRFPMAALRAALAADGYDGIVSLEWERLWHPGLPPLEDALTAAAERDWW